MSPPETTETAASLSSAPVATTALMGSEDDGSITPVMSNRLEGRPDAVPPPPMELPLSPVSEQQKTEYYSLRGTEQTSKQQPLLMSTCSGVSPRFSSEHEEIVMTSFEAEPPLTLPRLESHDPAAAVLTLVFRSKPILRKKIRQLFLLHPDTPSLTHAAQLRKSSPFVLVSKSPFPILPPQRRKRNVASVRGLRNYGQTCFLNSVLQALASLESVTVYLEHANEINSERRQFKSATNLDLITTTKNRTNDTTLQSSSLTQALLDVLLQVNGRSEITTPDPRPILRVVSQEHRQFKTRFHNEQQDAQELLQAVMDIVVEEGRFDLESAAVPSHFVATLAKRDEEVLTLVGDLHRRRQRNQQSAIGQTNSALVAMPTITKTFAADVNLTDLAAKKLDGADSPKSILPNKMNGLNGLTSSSSIQREEKKQEEFEMHIPRGASEENLLLDVPIEMKYSKVDVSDAGFHSTQSLLEKQQLSSAMRHMMTISSISPTPLSGWCGSALLCRSCLHVRPIQNTPFVDIPVVPTAVSDFLSARMPSSPGDPPRKPDGPPCRLEECLEEFTSIERVTDVECKCCTIKAEVEEQENERELLEEGIQRLLSRRAREQRSSAQEDVRDLQNELDAVERRLHALRKASPDDEEPLLATPTVDSFDDAQARPIRLKRSDAFKCLLLTRLPPVLAIHVQRRYYDPVNDQTSKTMQHVIFPEILDVSPYCAYGGALNAEAPFAGTMNKKTKGTDLRTPIRYRLMAVIEHQGGADSGHYICFRRDLVDDTRWLYTSDETVRVCLWDEVRKRQAYMLFYEAL